MLAPSHYVMFQLPGLIDAIKPGAMEMVKAGSAEIAAKGKDTIDELKSFLNAWYKTQSTFSGYQLEKLKKLDPSNWTGVVLIIKDTDTLLGTAAHPSVGQQTVQHSAYEPARRIFKKGGFDNLLKNAGITKKGLAYYPTWKTFHDRRKQATSVLSSVMPALDSSKYSSDTVRDSMDAVSKMYTAAHTLLSDPDDAKVARTMQDANKAGLEVFKNLLVPHRQLEQLFNDRHIDTAYSSSKSLSATEPLSPRGAKFVSQVEEHQNKMHGFKDSFFDSAIAGAQLISEKPFDGRSWFPTTWVNELTSKWGGDGLKNALHPASDDTLDADDHMSKAIQHVADTHPDTWQSKIDTLPEEIELPILEDLVRHATLVQGSLSKDAA